MSAKSKAGTTRNNAKADPQGRYEYRVWGDHREARKLLRKLAESETREEVEDCYLLVDDPRFNAKIRDNTLKVKELVDERKGFEQWTRDKHESNKSIPAPLDDLFEDIDLKRLRKKKKFDIVDAIDGLDPDDGVRPMFVTKRRRRYVVGNLRAEVTDIDIAETDETLRTISIEGDDLDELKKLRKVLGLKGENNTPVHQAIDPEFDIDLT